MRGKEFSNETLGVSLTTYKDQSNKVLFVGSQVAKVLGYKDTDKAIRQHVDDEFKFVVA